MKIRILKYYPLLLISVISSVLLYLQAQQISLRPAVKDDSEALCKQMDGMRPLQVTNCDSIDEEPPNILCPMKRTLRLGSDCTAVLPDYTSLAQASDNCGSVVITQNPAAGTPYSSMDLDSTLWVTLTAEDDSTNTSECTFTVVIRDRTAPTITCPGDQVLEIDIDCMAEMPDFSEFAITGDNCDPIVLTQVPAAGTVYDSSAVDSNIVVTMSAVDSSGNGSNCVFVVEIVDLIAPQFTCLEEQLLALDTNCQAELLDYSVLVDVQENCNSVTWTQDPAVGTMFDIEDIGSTITIDLVAYDDHGNSTECSFELEIADTIDPILICLSDTMLIVDENCEVTLPDFAAMITTTDNCGSVDVTQDPPSGTTYGSMDVDSSLIISIVADDGRGNLAACSFVVQISDTLSPTILCPEDQLLEIDSSCTIALPDYIALAAIIDDCDIDSVIQSPPIDTLVGPGNYLVSLTAMDKSGNHTSCTFNVTVEDKTAPIFTCPDDIIFATNEGLCGFIFDWTDPLVVDSCDGILLPERTDETGLNSGDLFPVGTTYTISYSVSDQAGNEATCSFDVSVIDLERPNLFCENDSLIAEGSDCMVNRDQLLPPLVTDNCMVDTVTNDAPSELPIGNTQVTWTAIDIHGNIDSCSQMITVIDTVAPTALCRDTILMVASDETINIAAEQLDSGSFDNCGIAMFSLNQSSFSCFDLGSYTITFTATDSSGNISTCASNVTVTGAGSSVVYVDSASLAMAPDGLSWGTAFRDIQSIFFSDCLAEVDTILIAEGTYFPDLSSRSNSFFFSEGVVIIGGYQSGGGVHDPVAHATKLSGEIGDATAADNSIHVVTILPSASDVQLRDLTIVGGMADGTDLNGNGAGILVYGTALLENVIIRDCESLGDGAAVYVNITGDITIKESMILNCNLQQGPIANELGGQILLDAETIIE